MTERRFQTPEEAAAYMREVAVERSGFTNWLAIDPIKVWEGESELTLAIRPEHTQHHGFAHCAILGVMADNACAWAAASVAGDVVTGGYTTNFLAPTTGPALRAKGKVVRAGKRQVVVRAEVWSEGGGAEAKLCAVAQATVMPV